MLLVSLYSIYELPHVRPSRQTDTMSASKRTVFVTVGATAPFDPLIEACLRPETLEALTSLGYTDLRLQYGNSARKETLQSYLQEVAKNFSLEHKINISGFDFAENLVSEVQAADLVISHAGMFFGSISNFHQGWLVRGCCGALLRMNFDVS